MFQRIKIEAPTQFSQLREFFKDNTLAGDDADTLLQQMRDMNPNDSVFTDQAFLDVREGVDIHRPEVKIVKVDYKKASDTHLQDGRYVVVHTKISRAGVHNLIVLERGDTKCASEIHGFGQLRWGAGVDYHRARDGTVSINKVVWKCSRGDRKMSDNLIQGDFILYYIPAQLGKMCEKSGSTPEGRCILRAHYTDGTRYTESIEVMMDYVMVQGMHEDGSMQYYLKMSRIVSQEEDLSVPVRKRQRVSSS